MAADTDREPAGQLAILDPDLCSGCAACVAVCRVGCIHATADPRQTGYVTGICIIDLTACIGCGDCVRICPRDAITAVPATNVPATLGVERHEAANGR